MPSHVNPNLVNLYLGQVVGCLPAIAHERRNIQKAQGSLPCHRTTLSYPIGPTCILKTLVEKFAVYLLDCADAVGLDQLVIGIELLDVQWNGHDFSLRFWI